MSRRVAARMLEMLGCRVDVVGSGIEALEAMDRIAYDVVLMDCQMPEMDGYQATRALRAKETGTGRRLPVIAMTAHTMKGDRERCLEAGMDDHLSKPVTWDVLTATVRRWSPPRPRPR